jgi:predicted GNAT family acetyltransferase
LSEAERLFGLHGRTLGVDLQRGRHRSVDAALRALELELVASRPAMAIRVDDLAPPSVPGGVDVARVTDPEVLAALVDVEVASFGTDRSIAERLLAPSQLSFPNVRLYAAIVDGRPVAQAYTNTVDGAVGIFGVATLPEYRRRGIGAAITAFSIHDVRDEANLAWLQTTEAGRPLYEAMGFRPVADWEVWTR